MESGAIVISRCSLSVGVKTEFVQAIAGWKSTRTRVTGGSCQAYSANKLKQAIGNAKSAGGGRIKTGFTERLIGKP